MKCDNLQRYSFDVDYEERVVPIKDDKGAYVLAIDADEAIAELRNENESLKYSVASLETDLAMSRRWRKCSEELPKDGSDVLATDGKEIWLCYKTTMTDGLPWFQPNGQPHIEGVTHWMPLPKAPEVDKIEKEKDPVLKIVQEWMDISGFPKAPEAK